MINHDFCQCLEYKISRAFKHSDNEQIKDFWCDGILLDKGGSFYSQKFVNDNRQVTLKAFLGKDGQTEFEMTLKFGNKSLSRYARSLDITECIPSPDKQNWFNIDTMRNTIEVHLD